MGGDLPYLEWLGTCPTLSGWAGDLPYLEWVCDGTLPLPGDGDDAVDGGGYQNSLNTHISRKWEEGLSAYVLSYI